MALQDTIREGINGYVYESGNLEELKQKIDLAYSTLPVLSPKCKEYVQQHSVEKSIDKLIALYEKTIER